MNGRVLAIRLADRVANAGSLYPASARLSPFDMNGGMEKMPGSVFGRRRLIPPGIGTIALFRLTH